MDAYSPTGADTLGLRWWQRAVCYQSYPLSFQDSNGDGLGDLPGIAARLEYLSWLGIGAVWLSPIHPSPMADFGYDIADFTGVDPVFGTLGDLDRLIAELHAREIKLILDFVPNHTSIEHPWFAQSRSSRANPKSVFVALYFADGDEEVALSAAGDAALDASPPDGRARGRKGASARA